MRVVCTSGSKYCIRARFMGLVIDDLEGIPLGESSLGPFRNFFDYLWLSLSRCQGREIGPYGFGQRNIDIKNDIDELLQRATVQGRVFYQQIEDLIESRTNLDASQVSSLVVVTYMINYLTGCRYSRRLAYLYLSTLNELHNDREFGDEMYDLVGMYDLFFDKYTELLDIPANDSTAGIIISDTIRYMNAELSGNPAYLEPINRRYGRVPILDN